MEFAFLPNSKKIMTEKGYIIPAKEKDTTNSIY